MSHLRTSAVILSLTMLAGSAMAAASFTYIGQPFSNGEVPTLNGISADGSIVVGQNSAVGDADGQTTFRYTPSGSTSIPNSAYTLGAGNNVGYRFNTQTGQYFFILPWDPDMRSTSPNSSVPPYSTSSGVGAGFVYNAEPIAGGLSREDGSWTISAGSGGSSNCPEGLAVTDDGIVVLVQGRMAQGEAAGAGSPNSFGLFNPTVANAGTYDVSLSKLYDSGNGIPVLYPNQNNPEGQANTPRSKGKWIGWMATPPGGTPTPNNPGTIRAYKMNGTGTIVVGQASGHPGSTSVFTRGPARFFPNITTDVNTPATTTPISAGTTLQYVPLVSGYNGGSANDISSDGNTTVGTSSNRIAATGPTGLAWVFAGGVTTTLSTPAGITFSGASGISRDGNYICGQTANGANGSAAIWKRNGANWDRTDLLLPLGANSASARAISNTGRVAVGFTSLPDFTNKSVIFRRISGLYIPSTIESVMSRAGVSLPAGTTITGINVVSADGKIVGGSCKDGSNQSRLWTAELPPMPCNLADITDGSGTGAPDGALTGSDVVAFFQFFFAPCTAPGSIPCSPADITDGSGTGLPDGSLTGSDVVGFFSNFFSPCSN